MFRIRFLRILRWTAIVLAALVVLAGGAVLYLLGTQSGARFLFARLGTLMPGSFAVRELDGPIRGPLTVHGLLYKRPGLEVHVDRIDLDWRLRELLARRLDIRHLHAEGVRILNTPSPEPSQPSNLPDLNLHFNIIVRDAQVHGLSVGAPGDPKPLVIDRIDLATTDIANHVRVDRLAVRSALLDADAWGGVQPIGDYPVDLALRWAVRPPGMAASAGSGTLKGTLKQLRVAQQLSAPFAVRLDALLSNPMSDLRFDGRMVFSGANPRLLKADLPDIPAAGNLTARGRLDDFTSIGWIEGTVAPAGRVAVNYQVARRGEVWNLARAEVAFPGTPTRLTASGRFDLSSPVVAGAAAAGTGTEGPAAGGGAAASRGAAGGAPAGGTAQAEASAAGPAGPGPGNPAGAQSAGAKAAQKVAQSLPQNPAQHLDVDLTASWHDLAWPPRGKASFASARGEAHVTARGTVDAFTSGGSLAATLAPVGPLAATYRLVRQGEDWRLERADVTVPGRATRLTAQGSARLHGQAVGLQAAASWSELAWPLAGPPTVRSPRGGVRVDGSLDRYRAALDADLASGAAGPGGGPIPPGHWTIQGTGDAAHFQIVQLTASLLSGQVAGRGEVAWSPRVSWDLRLDGQGLDPGALRPDLPGKLAFAAATRGTLAAAGPAATVSLDSLRGTLRQQPVAASAALRLDGSRIDISRLDATWGPTRLQASGLVGSRLDLGWNLTAPNLTLLLPSAAGSLSGRGRISGTTAQPHLQATVAGHGLRSGTDSAADLNLTADVDLAPTGTLQANATVKGLATAGQTADTVTVAANGTASAHTVTVTAIGLGDRPEARLDLAVAGGLQGGLSAQATWRGEIRTLNASAQPIGSWSLDHAVPLTASARALDLRDFCWHSGGARLCATAGWASQGPWQVDARLTALPLNLAKPLLPAELTVTGDVNGSLRARGDRRGLADANVDLAPGPGELRYPTAEGKTQSFRFDRGVVRAQAGPGGGVANVSFNLQGIGTAAADVRLPRLTQGGALKDQPLAGHVAVHWTSLAFVEAFAPDLRNVVGSLAADLDLGGTAGVPKLRGQVALSGGRAEVPHYGLDVREVRLTASGDGSGALALDGAARSGPGSVTISGRAGLVPSTATPVRLTIAGRNFQVMNTKEIQVQVSPRLDFSYQGTLARVTGDVEIPSGKVDIEKRGKAGPIEPSKDVVFVNGEPQGQEAAAKALAVEARVRVIVPPASFELAAFGLDAKPTGQILVIEEPGKPTSAVGQLVLDQGTFKAYGQNLTIERGRLIFGGGSVDNPGLDVRASRKSDDGTVTAGFDVSGTAKAPVVTVWSNPAMDQANALAYALLGHPLSQASSQQGNLLANAATSLGLKGGNLIAKNLASRFGLQQATLESSGGLSETSLVLGKYLSPRIYVIYGIGLFQPVNTFRVRYIINKNFTLQASESSAGTSADILFTKER
jgi:translocation and assembly module TamB